MSYRFEPLSSNHERTLFECGVPALNHYLRNQASQDVRRYIAACIVMVDERSPKVVVGYYTLSAYAVDVSAFPDELARKMPRYPRMPAVLIGRLARDTRSRGTGSLLLMDALKRAAAHVHSIAAMSVVVEAKNQQAQEFYERHGFIPFKDLTGKLFIPMPTIESMLKQSRLGV